MCKYIEELQVLNDLYNNLDKKYFDSALTKNGRKSIITIQSSLGINGHFIKGQIWQVDKNSMHEINLGAEQLKRDKYNIATTLLHEMIHEYSFYNKIADVSRNRRYHNSKFKKLCEERELNVDYDKTIGYSITSPTEQFKSFIDTLELNFQSIYRKIPFVVDKEKKSSSTKKIVCPSCGLTVRATKADLKIMCVECEELLEYEDTEN